MKVRYEFGWDKGNGLGINYFYTSTSDKKVLHSELGPAEIDAVGRNTFYVLGGEVIFFIPTTPELWEKYGDPQICNANKAP